MSRDHIQLHCSIAPHMQVSEFARKAKGRSAYKVQREFSEIKKRYWCCHLWGRGYFSSTSGNATDAIKAIPSEQEVAAAA